ncbi:MAG: PilZ domain-containing protein [Planctomycetota bacterium]
MADRDRREHPRVAIGLPTDITVVDVETGQPVELTEMTTLGNISRGGLCAKVKLPQDDELEKILTRRRLLHVRVHLGGHAGNVAGVCRVAWCEKVPMKAKTFLMGLAWSEISEENGARLEKFVRRKLGASGGKSRD